jgi:S-DNA-T family DNA segregation ATPase FtsK/SpoIIIE
LKDLGPPNFEEDILNSSALLRDSGDFEEAGEADSMYDEAVRIVLESRRASISLVQRKLRVGYNRAARLIETMEVAGIVSSVQHNGSREVLVENQQA